LPKTYEAGGAGCVVDPDPVLAVGGDEVFASILVETAAAAHGGQAVMATRCFIGYQKDGGKRVRGGRARR
jgi:hypothetical protein